MAHLLSLAGWTILPNLVTGWVQSLWYGISIRAGDPKPVPGSPQFNQHRRRIYIIVVSAYLLYTIYEADWDIRRASDFYQDLAVPHTVSDRELKSRFRRLAAIHHPDKVSSGAPNTDGYFVHLKLAQDTLLNPAKRYAYDRFGPDMLGWQRCSSIGDYVYQGVQSVIPYYGATAVFMYLLGLFGYLEWGKYWRWLALIVLCTFELSVISRPHFPPIAAKLINPLLTTFTSHPPYLPFQLVQLFRKMSITLSIALGQIGPLLQPPTATPAGVSPEVALRQQLDRLEQSANMANNQASILMQMEMSPFQHDAHDMNKVKGKISEWLANNTINQDPEVRDAVGTVMKKRRTDAPAGARGNR